MLRLMSAPAAAALLLIAAAPASADPPPVDPGGVAPVAANPAPAPAPAAAPWAAAAPVGPAGAPPAGAAPVVDVGRVAPAPPATMTTSDGAVLSVFGEDESRTPVPALTTAITTRDYDVDGVFRASITGSAAPAGGALEVGYQIGCGIDMGTGPGVLIGGNLGANAIVGFAGAVDPEGMMPWDFIPNVGVTGGGIITVALKPGIVNTVPVTKKQFKGESPRVAIRDVRVKIDGCVGDSFIRSYAVLARVTDEKDSILAWYGETTRV
jgi:hypothetical protein